MSSYERSRRHDRAHRRRRDRVRHGPERLPGHRPGTASTHQGPYVHVTAPPVRAAAACGGIATDGFGHFVEFTPPWNIGADVYVAWRRADPLRLRGLDRAARPRRLRRTHPPVRDPAAYPDRRLARHRGVRHPRRQPRARRHRDDEHRARPVQRRHGQRVQPQLQPTGCRSSCAASPRSPRCCGSALAGEQELWTAARLDIADVADKVLEAMKAGSGRRWRRLLDRPQGRRRRRVDRRHVRARGRPAPVISVARHRRRRAQRVDPEAASRPSGPTLPLGGETPSRRASSKLRGRASRSSTRPSPTRSP